MTLPIPLPDLVDDRTAAEWCRAVDRHEASQPSNDDQQQYAGSNEAGA